MPLYIHCIQFLKPVTWTSLCLLRRSGVLNGSSHSLHLNCLWLKWASVCSLRLSRLSDSSLHSLHPFSQACPSLIWNSLWLLRLSGVSNVSSHSLHQKYKNTCKFKVLTMVTKWLRLSMRRNLPWSMAIREMTQIRKHRTIVIRRVMNENMT